MSLTIIDHPLASHFLATLRDKDTSPSAFRVLARRITLMIALEATRSLATLEVGVDTPLETTRAWVLAQTLVAAPILRAGLGMLDTITELVPDVCVGYIGLERDEVTAVASSYYAKLPPALTGRPVFVLDPMLATGGSAVQAVDIIKAAGGDRISMLCVVAAPEGV
jgi:uracil phosphoribosyltransferase